MPQKNYTKPFTIFFLVLPVGISGGFVTVALPFLLTKNGFPVSQTAGIIALGMAANLWRFIWGPITDLALSLRKWVWIGVFVSVAMLLLLCITPFTLDGAIWLTLIVFLSQVAATFIMLPAGGFMAHRIEEKRKGSAAGWFQAGNLGGSGLGGGAGLWLATHYSTIVAGICLGAASLLSALVVQFIKDVHPAKEKSIKDELLSMSKDIASMVKIPLILFIISFICVAPIGTGAMANLWSTIATEWKADADTVALVTGIVSGLVSAAGCIVEGFIADRFGNWIAYFGAGVLSALVAIGMAILPFDAYFYAGGVLTYAFVCGLCYAAFSSSLLYGIGKKNAATKYALLSSLGNLPVVLMTAFNGWTHDQYNGKGMLIGEAGIGIMFILVALMVLNRMKAKKISLLPA
jgi:MFS family permease